MNILITGGHLTPALGLIDHLRQHQPSDTVIFLGREESQPGQTSQEKIEIEKRGLTFVSFTAPRDSSLNPLALITYVVAFSLSLLKALFLLIKFQPTVVCTFGGYLAPPVALAASALGVPVVTHEQTYVAGQANRLIALVATKIAVSYPNSLRFFPADKTVVTGNPLRASLVAPKKTLTKPSWLPSTITKPILYVTGGNQGSYVINSVVKQALANLTKTYFVIHACGNPSSYGDFMKDVNHALKRLPVSQKQSYVVQTWVNDQDLAWIYSQAFATVSRAGANTVAELTLAGIPTIFIPLPFAKGNEQELNVKPLVEAKASVLLSQSHLTPDSLLKQLELIAKRHGAMRNAMKKHAPATDGAEKLYAVLREVTQTDHV